MQRKKWSTLAVRMELFACAVWAEDFSAQTRGSGAMAATPAVVGDATVWLFAVSGDSRNCGDVVMPAIAAGAARTKPNSTRHRSSSPPWLTLKMILHHNISILVPLLVSTCTVISFLLVQQSAMWITDPTHSFCC
jgi:hypothetical protein